MSAKANLLAVAVLLAGCGGSGPALNDQPVEPDIKGGTTNAKPAFDFKRVNLLKGLERRTLDNGLVVLVKEDRRLPTVTIMTTYRVGSVNEEAGITGVSHFLEHMLFKGTDKFGRGDIDLLTYRAGGSNNAFTTNDMTGYWFHVSSDKLEDFIALEANRMTNCTLDATEFENEKEVVLEEIRRHLDDPWGELGETVEKTVYRHSRYHHPVLGWRRDIHNMTRDQMADYYRSFYRPNNAAVVIVGNVDRDEAFSLVEKHFGAIPKGRDASQAIGQEPPQDGERRVDLRSERDMNRLMIAFRTDRIGTNSDYRLDVLSTLLTEGKGARLNRRLVEREGLTRLGGVSTTNDSRKYDGIFTIEVELSPGKKIQGAERAVLDELERLKTEPVEARELQRAKNLLTADFVFRMESQYELAEAIGYFEALGVPNYLSDYLAKINELKPEDIQKAAGEFFKPERRTIGSARAKGSRAPGIRRGKWRRRADRRFGGLPQDAPEIGSVWEYQLESGLRIIAKRKADVPVLYIRAFVDAGADTEPLDKAGLANLVGELVDEGTKDPVRGRALTHEEISDAIEFVGGTLKTGPTGVTIKVVSKDKQLAYDLVRDLLRYPSFPKSRIEKIRKQVLADIASAEDRPRSVARSLFYSSAYPGHPHQLPDRGTQTTVKKITREDILAHYRAFWRPRRTTIVIVGDIQPRRAITDLWKRFEAWIPGGESVDPPEWKTPGPKALRVNRYMDTNQANVYIGHPGIRRNDPDFTALRVAESIFCQSAGFTDRLSKTVRDEKGLAYSVGGTITGYAGREPGPFIIYVGTRIEKKDEAIRTVLEELRRFVERGPTREEVADARNFLARNFPFDWEISEGVAAYLLKVRRFNLGMDYGRRFVRELRSITREKVHEAVKRHLHPDKLTIVVVGKVDKNGKIIEKKDE